MPTDGLSIHDASSTTAAALVPADIATYDHPTTADERHLWSVRRLELYMKAFRHWVSDEQEEVEEEDPVLDDIYKTIDNDFRYRPYLLVAPAARPIVMEFLNFVADEMGEPIVASAYFEMLQRETARQAKAPAPIIPEDPIYRLIVFVVTYDEAEDDFFEKLLNTIEADFMNRPHVFQALEARSAVDTFLDCIEHGLGEPEQAAIYRGMLNAEHLVAVTLPS